MLASFLLYLSDFPAGAGVGEVSQETVWQLGAYYVPAILSLWMIMIAIISGYKLDRTQHEENLRQLAAQAKN